MADLPPSADSWSAGESAPPLYDQAGQGAPPETRRVPGQVIATTVLLAIFGLLGLLVGWLLLSVINDDTSHGESVSGTLYFLAYLQFTLSALQILSGLLVLKGWNWGRILAITLCSVNLLGGLIDLFSGAPLQAVINFALNIALIRMLTRDTVADWCR
jgi:hypothetical protein